jgi:hypothetical protein
MTESFDGLTVGAVLRDKAKRNARPLWFIAREIAADWSGKGKGVSPYAKPYLDAMGYLNTVRDNYFHDTGSSVVAYFLANAGSWRGDVARRVKAELKAML